MKKVLFLHSGAELYGADQILLTIVSKIDKKKYMPIIVLPNEGPLCQKLLDSNVSYRIINYPIIRRKYFNPIGIINYIFNYIKACKKLKKIIENDEIDIVHCNTIAVLEGIYLKKHSNIFLISHVHEMLEKPRLIAKILYHLNLKYCDSMIVVSNSVKKHILSLVKDKKNKISVIHNGIDDCSLIQKNKKEFCDLYNIPYDSIIIAFVGRINAIKGYNDFVDALDKVTLHNRKVYGVVIGDAFSGQEWRVEELKNKILKLNNSNIMYCGFINNIKEYYGSFDLLILPSVGMDSFPTVVLEAMSCSVPCVAYNCGGVVEMIKDGYNGYIISQGDVIALTNKIDELVRNNELKELKNNAKSHYSNNFKTDSFVLKIEDVYKRNDGR